MFFVVDLRKLFSNYKTTYMMKNDMAKIIKSTAFQFVSNQHVKVDLRHRPSNVHTHFYFIKYDSNLKVHFVLAIATKEVTREKLHDSTL